MKNHQSDYDCPGKEGKSHPKLHTWTTNLPGNLSDDTDGNWSDDISDLWGDLGAGVRMFGVDNSP